VAALCSIEDIFAMEIPAEFTPLRFKSAYLGFLGPFYETKRDGSPVVGLLLEEKHMNLREIAHGGVLTTLADVGLSFPIAASEDPPLGVATITLSTDFIGAANLGDWLEATAVIDRKTRSLAFAHGRISRGGEPLLTMTGVYKLYRQADA
jgi:uncharacterized protein (TIGR00369 family)